ncbi:MAG TPA: hypothetical protein VK869_11030 [Rubrobacteraceae bacterium]|nr:hypothetical protein [Rubrobacteraceae bacterium]
MLLDLIRALSAGVVVGVLPGWFWARVLCSTTDHAERLAYSVALSLALVPACALAQSALFGTGVTLPVAVSSVLLVLFGGFAAHLRFGPASGKDTPLFSPPISPGVPSLVLLPAAFGLSMWAATGMTPGVPRFVLPMVFLVPTALLMFVAGVIHLLTSPRDEPAPTSSPGARAGWWRRRLSRSLALPAVLLLALAQGYLGPVRHDWPFIRGVDHYSHGVMAELMLTKGEIHPYLIYPPGFHTMTAMVSRLSGLEPLEIFPVLGPALWLLPPLALYALARRLWGWGYGVAAAGLTVILGGTYYYYHDAMYPNLVTSQFLLVLTVAVLCVLYGSPSARTGLLLATLGSSVVLYHQVSSMYAAALLALVAVFLVPFLLLHDRRRGLALLSSLTLLGALSVVYAWDTYDLAGTAGELLGLTEGSATGAAVGMAMGTQDPYDLRLLVGTMVSQPVAWLGILGVFVLLRELRERVETPRALAYLTLLFWVLLLFVGSRTSMVGFPQRFGRDLGIPLAILAAIALVAVVRSLGTHRRPAAAFAASLAVITVGALVGLQTARSVQYAAAPSIQMTITPEIAEAGEWLRQNNEGGNIMVSPHVNQVPSRMMLAMGGYTALQSFEIWQIRVPRDLPPTGPEPPLDVLRVVKDPEDEQVPGLLEKHDVRYIVLYKDMPDRDTKDYWKLFKARPDLYETAFENEDVLIAAPRYETTRTGSASPTL